MGWGMGEMVKGFKSTLVIMSSEYRIVESLYYRHLKVMLTLCVNCAGVKKLKALLKK